MTLKYRLLWLAAIFALITQCGAFAQDRSIVVASTTSTEQSGLFGFLLPRFTEKSGINVKVVAVGTGQALDIGRRGDADVVFVHDKAAEEKFMAEGFGVRRFDVMYNDFVVIGPKTDPAHITGSRDVTAAFRNIAATKAPFISRGDRSGTNAAELRYWKDAGIDIDAIKGAWYRDIGQGMGVALNMAASVNAYLLADRGTWLSLKNRGELTVLVEGDKRLFNQYGVDGGLCEIVHCPTGKSLDLVGDGPVQPLPQKYFCFSEMQIKLYVHRPVPQRGGSRSSRTRDRMRWTRMALLTNGAEADGKDVWS
jgi:tungstate transport system substrate-binding protein